MKLEGEIARDLFSSLVALKSDRRLSEHREYTHSDVALIDHWVQQHLVTKVSH